MIITGQQRRCSEKILALSCRRRPDQLCMQRSSASQISAASPIRSFVVTAVGTALSAHTYTQHHNVFKMHISSFQASRPRAREVGRTYMNSDLGGSWKCRLLNMLAQVSGTWADEKVTLRPGREA